MTIGNRSIIKIVKAPFQKVHWVAFYNMIFIYKKFPSVFYRYFFAKGKYPYEVILQIKAVKQKLSIMTYCHDDILTVNEIFCRKDYSVDKNIKIVVDIGSNIGISALYFLTLNNYSYCYLYEPVSENIVKLKNNLKGYESRYNVNEIAVYDKTATLDFGVEPTGRYGGIDVVSNKTIKVDCININDVLVNVLEKHEYIDILKIDTEGTEIQTVQSIKSKYLNKIKNIYIEAHPKTFLLDNSKFVQVQYGTVCKITNQTFKSLYRDKINLTL
ncbi:MAG: FkbM family methyltransferase [Oscillospiraceae bacterium]|jgi:FkbM family methyltransferase|nr:FkbM family methyltransferase [Oscillospiraceae bacterium]